MTTIPQISVSVTPRGCRSCVWGGVCDRQGRLHCRTGTLCPWRPLSQPRPAATGRPWPLWGTLPDPTSERGPPALVSLHLAGFPDTVSPRLARVVGIAALPPFTRLLFVRPRAGASGVPAPWLPWLPWLPPRGHGAQVTEMTPCLHRPVWQLLMTRVCLK